MKGRHPKPANLRQNRTVKSGRATISAPESVDAPQIPNPDNRVWHPLTLKAWAHMWASPMSTQWIETDIDSLGQLAVLYDEFYKAPNAKLLAEIRLQRSCFGLTPLDRSRLQWEVSRSDEAEQKQQRRQQVAARRTGMDPRAMLMAVK
jgi:hypothetical protein